MDLTPPPRQSSGIGKLVSFINFIALFTVLPSFLHLLWPTLLEIPDPYFHFTMIIATNFIVFTLYNLGMLYIYNAKLPFFQKYRTTNKPWPWEIQNKSKWQQFFKKTITTVLLNMFFYSLFPMVFQYLTTTLPYSKSINFPSPLTLLLQFLFFMVVQDITFYFSHRTLHNPLFYPIHKQHHEYTTTITLAATYTHPIEYIFGNVLPTGIGYHILSKFVEVHYVVIIIWLVFRSIQTCDGHSGYDWSWGQMAFNPWKLGPDYHDFHHSHNVGNYGSMFGFWDNIMGSNKQYRKYKAKLSNSSKLATEGKQSKNGKDQSNQVVEKSL